MKFKISRASISPFDEDDRPHKSAYFEAGIWYIHFRKLEELMKFIKEEGEIVLGDDSILIYDDYLE